MFITMVVRSKKGISGRFLVFVVHFGEWRLATPPTRRLSVKFMWSKVLIYLALIYSVCIIPI
jgi:hypothetical protein